MKFLTIIAGLSPIASFAAARTCPSNGRNCARAVTGTFRGQQASRLGDCSSFAACTVTPTPDVTFVTTTVTLPINTVTVTDATTTTTTTITTTVTQDPTSPARKKRIDRRTPALEERQNAIEVTTCPTATPAYASVCSGVSAYISACSCAGITRKTTTIQASTITVTATTTTGGATTTEYTTATATATATATQIFNPQFIIKVGEAGSTYLSVGNIFYVQDTQPAGAVRVNIQNGNLYNAASNIPCYTSDGPSTDGVFLYYKAPYDGNVTPVPTSLGAYNAAVGGYALTISPPNKPFIVNKQVTPANILAQTPPPGPNGPFLITDLYAIFV